MHKVDTQTHTDPRSAHLGLLSEQKILPIKCWPVHSLFSACVILLQSHLHSHFMLQLMSSSIVYIEVTNDNWDLNMAPNLAKRVGRVHPRVELHSLAKSWQITIIFIYIFQPHNPSQHDKHQPAAGQDHGGPPILHRDHLRHLPVSEAGPQHLRGLSSAK